MKGSIPRQFIDDLLTKSNIVDVINARVKLKKADEIIKLVVRFITKKHHPSRSVRKNNSIIALVVGRKAMPFHF